MNRFLLARHPLHPSDDQICIIHVIDPIAVIQILDGHIEFDQGTFCCYQDRAENRQIIKFTLHMLAFSPEDERISADRERKLMRRAWHWYRRILQLLQQPKRTNDEK